MTNFRKSDLPDGWQASDIGPALPAGRHQKTFLLSIKSHRYSTIYIQCIAC
jgi:hypothetical protein